jgi:ssDNA-binding Zn-finger/Zn-ribbon topoisomerase 1
MVLEPQVPEVPGGPTKVCPHCSVMSQTTAEKCPNCGKPFKVKVKKRGGCLKIILGVIGALVVIGIIASVAGNKKSSPVKAADITQRVDGTFVRSGCFGCSNTEHIATSDVYCGWDGDNVVVHVLFGNDSVESLKVIWHPSY